MKPFIVMVALAAAFSTVLLNGQSVDYLTEIKPLLKQRCYSCHGALKQKVELRLDTAEFIRKGSKHGPVVQTNFVNESPLLARVTSKDADERMPPEGEPLSAGQIEMLRRWIAAGTPAPTNEKPEPDPREHWAFRPPIRPKVPKAHSSSLPTPLTCGMCIPQFIRCRWDGKNMANAA
jgi:Planctomycete cytochrome C